MAQTFVNIPMDTELKSQFEAFCVEVGLSMTTAINALVRKAIQEDAIPVETLTDIPNEETRQSLENIRLGVHLSRPFSSVRELMEDLDADD